MVDQSEHLELRFLTFSNCGGTLSAPFFSAKIPGFIMFYLRPRSLAPLKHKSKEDLGHATCGQQPGKQLEQLHQSSARAMCGSVAGEVGCHYRRAKVVC